MTTVQMWNAEMTLLLLSVGFFVLPFAVQALGYHDLARNLFPFAAMAVPCMAGAGALRGARRRKQRSGSSPKAVENRVD